MKKIALLTSLLALAACGGGSGGGSSAPTYIPSLSEELSGLTAEQAQTARKALGSLVAVSNADTLMKRAKSVYGENTTIEQTLEFFANSIETLNPENITEHKNAYETENPESNYFESDEFKQMCELLNMDPIKYTSCINSSTNCDYVSDVLESDNNKLITQDIYSGDLQNKPTWSGDGINDVMETMYFVADKATGDVILRTYTTECPVGKQEGCASDSRGFIKDEFVLTNLNDFTNGVHKNGMTAFLNTADKIGLQYGDMFASQDPSLNEEAISIFFAIPVYYNSKLVDMYTMANSLTESTEYKGKAYGTITTEAHEKGTTNDSELVGIHTLASINTDGQPIGTDATLTFNPNNGAPIETLHADFSAFNWYDTTITAENGVVTDIQLIEKGNIASGFEVSPSDTYEGEVESIYLGSDKNSVASEALNSYHVEWEKTTDTHEIDTILDVTFGGVKQ